MDNIFPLNIFPPGGLESSVVTTVWVGVMVIVFLNLRFGMTMAGLVIPGYLVPLFFVKPISAFVVVVEGIVTYGIAYLFANSLLVKFKLSEMFGRDRFLALILISIVVRVSFDYFLLPLVGQWANTKFGSFNYDNHLQSFGLIIVALIANQMWNGGLWRGLKAFTSYTLLTYLIIAFLLVPLTNFSVAGLSYMYEDLATSLLSSPKAYIILITTAYIASRMNLKYGWEFNGILIPALLSLQWYQPEKLLYTFIEALLILLLGKALMSSQWFRHSNIEGSRLFLLFFNIGFIYKIILGYVLINFFPAIKITDYYGFGYVVSTLIAIKVHQKHIAIQMTRSTLQTSFISIILASILGFSLTYITPEPDTTFTAIPNNVMIKSSDSVINIYNQNKFESFEEGNTAMFPSPQKLAKFEQSVQWISNSLTNEIPTEKLIAVTAQLKNLGFNVYKIGDDKLALHLPSVGFYVFRMQPQNQLVIQAPRAKNEVGTDLLALQLFEKYSAKAVMLDMSSFRGGEQTTHYDSMLHMGYFQALHKHITRNDVLQIRGDLREHELRRLKRQKLGAPLINVMRIKKRFPPSLPLDDLFQLIPNIKFDWRPNNRANPQREYNLYGFAELYLSKPEVQRALNRLALMPSQPINQLATTIDGYLMQWIVDFKQKVARKGSEQYRVPSERELLYWDQEVLTPLMLWLQNYNETGWTEALKDELNRITYLASGFGYEIVHFKYQNQNKEYLVLHEQANKENRYHWASLFINLSAKSELFIQVPNPFYENTSFEFGASLFEKSNARFLLLAGSHPWANRNGKSNVTKLGNRHTLFHLIHQVALRELNAMPLLPIQIRGYSFQAHRPFPHEEVLVSLWQQIDEDPNNTLVKSLLGHLDDYNLSYRIADGDKETSAYTFTNNQQSSYMTYANKDNFVSLWLNPAVRRSFRTISPDNNVHTQMKTLGLETKQESLTSYLNNVTFSDITISQALQAQLTNYANSQNIHYLHQAMNHHPAITLRYVQDMASLQDFVVLFDQDNQWIAVLNLATFNQRKLNYLGPTSVSQFLANRAMWLGLSL